MAFWNTTEQENPTKLSIPSSANSGNNFVYLVYLQLLSEIGGRASQSVFDSDVLSFKPGLKITSLVPTERFVVNHYKSLTMERKS